VKGDFVVERSSVERMRMADDGGMGRGGRPGIEQGFEASGGAGNNWANKDGAVAVISNAPINPWMPLSLMPLSLIKLTRTLADFTLKYYVAYY